MTLNVDNTLRFFVWEPSSKLVLCETLSGTLAHAVSEGILNSQVHVSFPVQYEAPQFLIYDHLASKLCVANFTPSEKHLKLIKLATLRKQYIHRLEVLLQKYVDTYCSPIEVQTHNYLSTLSLGEDFNISHPLVVEYSGILGISNTEGYNDLKMRFDSYGLLKIKAFAFFEKFKKQINACYIEQEAISILEQAKYELYTASHI
jgi:hypothetical protein